jgi:hypothetical protein
MAEASGLPDYDDPKSTAFAHPAHAKLEVERKNLSDPRWFRVHPKLAWGFLGARLKQCRTARPHGGFAVIARWIESVRDGAFVVTSSADGQFQRASFFSDRIVECRGAIEWLQCTQQCGDVFPGGLIDVEIDDETGFAKDPLPTCPRCGSLARPNILLPDDKGWDSAREAMQEERLDTWLGGLREQRDRKVVVLECGAKPRDPSGLRARSERAAAAMGGTLVRIAEEQATASPPHIAIEMPIVDALVAIDTALARITRR